MTATRAGKAVVPAVMAALTALLTACAAGPKTGPLVPPVSSNAASALLPADVLSTAAGAGWAQVSGAADYLPHPCSQDRNSPGTVATWRNGTSLIQIRLLTYPSTAAAASATHTASLAAQACQTWLDGSGTWSSTPLTAVPATAVARAGNDITATGTRAWAWSLTTVGTRAAETVVSIPGQPGACESLLRTIAPLVHTALP